MVQAMNSRGRPQRSAAVAAEAISGAHKPTPPAASADRWPLDRLVGSLLCFVAVCLACATSAADACAVWLCAAATHARADESDVVARRRMREQRQQQRLKESQRAPADGARTTLRQVTAAPPLLCPPLPTS